MVSTALSKIAVPVLPPTILHRESLIERLHSNIIAQRHGFGGNVARNKLFLLCAPAGYGKTTLLADFARITHIACCWYFLDQNDADAYTFLSGLLASLRHRFPGLGPALDTSLSLIGEAASRGSEYDIHQLEAFIDALMAALDATTRERFAFMLCNYHEVDASKTITHLVNHILRCLPLQCVLVIESRATPTIEFASLLAHRQAAGLGNNLLRMNVEEILALAQAQGVVPPTQAEAEQLTQAFDGWIAGILLGTRLGDAELLHAGSRTGILQSLPSMRVEKQNLFAYLVDEVFQRQPTVYAFLKEAALLQKMIPSQCDALLNVTSSAEYLEQLARQGMFVTCSDEGTEPVYTCHPILRELLYDELRLHDTERFVNLHLRASELFSAAHDYDRAISHAFAADDNDRVAKLIIQAYSEMSTIERPEILHQWLDQLSPYMLEQFPQLLLIRASLHLLRGEYYQALPLLDIASNKTIRTDVRTVVDASDLPRLQAEILILRGKALFQAGQYQEAQLLCLQVLETTPMDEVEMRAEAHTRFGICANVLGNIPSAIEHLQKALQLWGRHTIQRQTADVHSVLASAYNMMGNFALAEHHLSSAITCSEQLHDEKGKINNLVRMAVYKQRQGLFTEAETILTQLMTTVRATPGLEREASYILVNLGSVYQDQGRYDQSLKTLEEGLGLTRQQRDNYLMNCCLCYLATTYLFMGDSSTALLLLSETNLPPVEEARIGYERAIHDLAYASILLQQQQLDDAYVFLTNLESSLKAANLKRELLRAKVLLATCQLVRGKQEEVIHNLSEVATILSLQDYGQLVIMALQRRPALYKLVKTHPDLDHIRNLLHIETSARKTKVEEPTRRGKSASLQTVTSQPPLRVQAFGEPTVFLDEQPITRWRMARSMELFFYLLDCGRPMRKEQIITALWSQVDDQINQTFHSTIHYLRKALNDTYFVSRNGTYSLDLAALSKNEHYYDVALFKEHHAQVKRLLASQNDEQAKALLLTMVELYQGDYVQSFYSDWCTFRRDELRGIYLEARNHLAHITWRQEEYDESAIHWQHMLAIDSLTEEAHYGLMKYYLRTGKRGLALRQYQRCLETLKQELGARPGTAIQNLYQRIINSSPAEQGKKNGKTSPLSEEVSSSR